MFVEVRVAEEDSDLLLAAVEEAEAPVRGLVIEVEAAVEFGAGGAASRALSGGDGVVVGNLAPAQTPVAQFQRN